ncbi:hypothetical protein Tco_1018894 [Tanacetum coccineum]|uniref:Uncharacterized protein n=1 Tax=Tanacetum coccineum TaxID=301880 RepID=A0ABQ5FWR0_9ASTR
MKSSNGTARVRRHDTSLSDDSVKCIDEYAQLLKEARLIEYFDLLGLGCIITVRKSCITRFFISAYLNILTLDVLGFRCCSLSIQDFALGRSILPEVGLVPLHANQMMDWYLPLGTLGLLLLRFCMLVIVIALLFTVAGGILQSLASAPASCR